MRRPYDTAEANVRLFSREFLENIFLHHPFFDYPYNKEKNLTKNVSISRIDFDKNIDIILRSNLLLKTNKIDIYGAKNGLYVYHKLKNKLHLELDNYKGTFTKSFDELSSILKDVKFVIDMSSIKNDGGGTQYTFLEAIHHECVLILYSEWTNNLNTNFKHGYNCFIVSNEKELIEIIELILNCKFFQIMLLVYIIICNYPLYGP